MIKEDEMKKIKQNPFVKKLGFNRLMLIVVLIVMYLVFCAICNRNGRNRLLHRTGYVLLCTYFRIHVHSAGNADRLCNLPLHFYRILIRCI